MSITKVYPSNSLVSFQDQFTRLFNDAFTSGPATQSDLTTWAPAVDIYETENEMVVKADLPDLEEKDINVRVEKNTLSISGERKVEHEVKEENFLRVERAYGAFARSFSLPNTIKADAIRAEYNKGVLMVHLPKREESKPKQIKIDVSSNGN